MAPPISKHKPMRSHRRATIMSAIVLIIFLLSKCVEGPQKADTVSEEESLKVMRNISVSQFAGSEACKNCHKTVHRDHVQTAHFLTSGLATLSNVHGSFKDGKNEYAYLGRAMVRMEKRDSGLFQVGYLSGEEKVARRFDIAVGSGTMGQSFLNWQGNRLFQLPITYFSAADRWSNSPGFPNDRAIFNRMITSRCMECHSTFASVLSPPGIEPEEFDKRIIYGVDCEKCHGPAAAHVQFQSAHPEDTSAKFIVNPATFSRQQKLDLCALCHGGRLQKTAPSFQFVVGDTLSHFFKVDTSMPDPSQIDVHGNQYGLLRASKCFRMDETLTCNSCHNTHKNERNQKALFSKRCMNCHGDGSGHGKFCPMGKQLGSAIKKNCVDCHMPLKDSRAISVFLPGERRPKAAMIRSHFISIYPEETKKLMGEFLRPAAVKK